MGWDVLKPLCPHFFWRLPSHSAPTALTSLLFLKWNKYAPLSRSLPFLFCLEFSSPDTQLLVLSLRSDCCSNFTWSTKLSLNTIYIHISPTTLFQCTYQHLKYYTVCVYCLSSPTRRSAHCEQVLVKVLFDGISPKPWTAPDVRHRHWNKYLFNGLEDVGRREQIFDVCPNSRECPLNGVVWHSSHRQEWRQRDQLRGYCGHPDKRRQLFRPGQRWKSEEIESCWVYSEDKQTGLAIRVSMGRWEERTQRRFLVFVLNN